ncbi:MAG: Ig-like domain-containing protein, partial [Chloroflexi bacterium]|nr:Ig-like domain-containing protein [Chloroflexota bacterium]
MSRRTIERAGLVVGLGVLLVVLASATLLDRRPPAVEGISLSRVGDQAGLALTRATVDVTFSEAVQTRSAELRFRIQPAVDGAFSWDAGRTMIFTPSAPLPVATDFTVLVGAGVVDLAGNVSETDSQALSFRTVDLPSLASTSPVAEAAGVGLGDPIRLTFDRLMDTELTARAVELKPAAPFAATWQGTTLIVAPTEALAPGTRYEVEVGAEAADTDGNRLGSVLSFGFTTVSTGLGLSAVIPAEGSAGAPVTGPIALVFERAIDPASVADSLRVTPAVSGTVTATSPPDEMSRQAAGSPASGSPSEATPASVLLLQPTEPLAPNTTYTVELLAGVVRAAGSTEAADARTWQFTTGQPLEPASNQVLFLADRGGVQNVWAMNSDGTNGRQLTAEIVPVTAYDIDADGALLTYAAGGAVRTLSLADGTLTTLTEPSYVEYGPRLVAGEGVLVGRLDLDDVDLGYWLRPLDGGEGRQLLASGAPKLNAGASPVVTPTEPGAGSWGFGAAATDGAIVMLRDATGELIVVDVATGASRPTGLRDPQGPPAWADRRDAFLVVAT